MRKLLLLSILALTTKLHANQDTFGSMRPAAWRSSTTCNAENFVILATGSVHIHAVTVDSATVNSGGSNSVALFNSTAPPNASNFANFFTTGTFTTTNVAGTGPTTLPPNVYDVPFSSGVIVNKQGTACVDIIWDFVYPRVDKIFPFSP